nr:isoleucine--tRNA ligase, cytoplasmic [Tanacetum cinerariifolium]
MDKVLSSRANYMGSFFCKDDSNYSIMQEKRFQLEMHGIGPSVEVEQCPAGEEVLAGNARDRAISRSRLWGIPLPIWISDDGVDIIVVGFVEEFERYSGEKVTDLHSHKMDHITIPSPRGPEFGVLHHVVDVFDNWFESGSMPYV